MDNQSNRTSFSTNTSKLVSYINQLQEHEQGIVDDMILRINTLKNRQQSNKSSAEEVKQLQHEFTRSYETAELVDFQQNKMCSQLTNIQKLSDVIRKHLYETHSVLRDIEKLAAEAKNIVWKKQTKFEQIKNTIDQEYANLQEEHQKLSIKMEDLRQDDNDLLEIKNEVEVFDSLIKTHEDEIKVLSENITSAENQLDNKESALNDETQIIDLKSSIDTRNIEKINIEEEIDKCKALFNTQKLEMEKFTISQQNLLSLINKYQAEIIDVKKENVQMENNEIFQLTLEEQSVYENTADQLTQEIDELKNAILSVSTDIAEENNTKDNLIEEIRKLELETKNQQNGIEELDNQVQAHKNKDVGKLLEESKQNTTTTFDKIFEVTSEIVELKVHIHDLQTKIESLPSINDEDVQAIKMERDNFNKTMQVKLTEMEEDYQNFIKDQERFKAKIEKDMAEKIANFQQQIKETEKKIVKSAQAERDADMTLQSNMVECDIFTRKLKIAEETRERLKKELESLQKPTQPLQRKRHRYYTVDSNFNDSVSTKDPLKNKMAKKK